MWAGDIYALRKGHYFFGDANHMLAGSGAHPQEKNTLGWPSGDHWLVIKRFIAVAEATCNSPSLVAGHGEVPHYG